VGNLNFRRGFRPPFFGDIGDDPSDFFLGRGERVRVTTGFPQEEPLDSLLVPIRTDSLGLTASRDIRHGDSTFPGNRIQNLRRHSALGGLLRMSSFDRISPEDVINDIDPDNPGLRPIVRWRLSGRSGNRNQIPNHESPGGHPGIGSPDLSSWMQFPVTFDGNGQSQLPQAHMQGPGM
jgi:hypothetical protein